MLNKIEFRNCCTLRYKYTLKVNAWNFLSTWIPFLSTIKNERKRKKKGKETSIRINLHSKKENVQKEDLPSWNIQNESRFEHATHSINDVSFLLFPLPVPTDNSRFIGIHIHRRDRTPRYSSNEQVTRRNGTFKRRSIGGPVEKETPYLSSLCGNYEADIRSTRNYHLNCKKPIRIYIYNGGELFEVGQLA